jgi:hypothetical protein
VEELRLGRDATVGAPSRRYRFARIAHALSADDVGNRAQAARQ